MAFRDLLEKAIVKRGPSPFEGGKWRTISKEFDLYQDRDLAKRSRIQAMQELDADFEWIVATELGRHAKPEDWDMIVLDGQWLLQTKLSPTRAIWDCTFAFCPKELAHG